MYENIQEILDFNLGIHNEKLLEYYRNKKKNTSRYE